MPRRDAEVLCSLARSLFERGLTPGRTGNLSVRVGDVILMSPSGSSLGTLDPDGLSVVALDGAHVGGPPPSKETFLHLALYQARPDDRAVAHTHSRHAVAVSCLDGLDDNDALPPLTAYFAMRIGRLPRLPYYAPGDHRLGDSANEAARNHPALLLSNHGPIAAGPDLPSAVDLIEEIEETASVFLTLGDRPVRHVPRSAT